MKLGTAIRAAAAVAAVAKRHLRAGEVLDDLGRVSTEWMLQIVRLARQVVGWE